MMPHNRRNYNKTHSIALSGLLFALAMALSFIEGTLVIPGLLPGMKLGLANIVVMYALFFMGPKQALVLDVLKAFFVFLVSGWTAGFLALTAGDVAALLSLPAAAYLVHPVGLRRAGPQHRPAAGGQCHPFHSRVPLLCTDYAGAGPYDGNAHQCHPAGYAACAGTAGL